MSIHNEGEHEPAPHAPRPHHVIATPDHSRENRKYMAAAIG
jgi:hypothetical protein